MSFTLFAQGLNNISLAEKGKAKEGTICLEPPPSPSSLPKAGSGLQSSINTTITNSTVQARSDDSQSSVTELSSQETVEDDSGDFQAAG